jgi:7-cyano-7-deazaguanine synthase
VLEGSRFTSLSSLSFFLLGDFLSFHPSFLFLLRSSSTAQTTMIPKTIIHLLSGGLDSVTLLYDLHAQGHYIHCLMVDYQQQHKQELLWAKTHAIRLGLLYSTLNIPELGGLTQDNWIVPNRNAILLNLAVNRAIKAGADTVTIGCNADDSAAFPDCRKSFLDSMNAAVRSAGYDVEICAPYLDKKKWQIADIARQMGVKLSEIWTCYKGGLKPCGECPACKKLSEAMR